MQGLQKTIFMHLPNHLNFHSRSGLASVSILQSKREIEDLLKLDIDVEDSNNNFALINRQITSGIIIDWKQFNRSNHSQGHLYVTDGEKDEKSIFSLLVEEWISPQKARVIYKWVRVPKNNALGLIEEEHIYRGEMCNRRKEGHGQYLIIRRYSDSTENVKSIRGFWINDILESGTVITNGVERVIAKNILHSRSRRRLSSLLEMNRTIYQQQQRLSKKKLTFNKNLASGDSKDSVSSILEKCKSRQGKQ